MSSESRDPSRAPGRARRAVAALVVLALVAVLTVAAAEEKENDNGLPTLAEKTAGLEAHRGLLTFWTDAARGRVWLELPPPAGERGEIGTYLYLAGIVQGVGSNPIGLDRGQQHDPRLVTLRRLGGRVLIEQQNPRFRALTDDPLERQAVRESFATSVLWAGEVAALGPDGSSLVDWTGFLLRDAHGVAKALEDTGQGSFSLDEKRSAVDLEACLAFPENLELEALVTFAGGDPGSELEATVPDPSSVTVVQHHSLVALPGPGYEPRRYDPRAGSYAVTFHDYAAPLDEPLEKRWIVRHRLHKADPGAAVSPPVEPLVYYLDPGTPEPVRSALMEGASWWARAFEEAGFVNAFRVELLPPGAHPLDVRYNVIQWVHRATRGWSYGGGIIDPRTGEMIKGHVWLGSLRVRQDRLLFEALAGTAETGTGSPSDPVELALARIRQLAAHEVGHALGLNHNFAASTYGGRASVMDYPAPLVLVTDDGALDFSQAYGVGVGEWDVHAIRWAYSQPPPGGDEAAMLEGLVADGLARGLAYLSDEDARPTGGAHPLAHLWDNGADAAAGLEHALAVRALALSRFGPGNVAPGRPLAGLEEAFAILYLHHRYQLEAAVKLVAGVDYRYALAGDGQPPQRPVDGAWQRRALAAVLATLDPAVLDIPDEVLAVLLPRPAGYEPHRELFSGAAGPVFDPLAAAATAAGMTAELLLDPARAVRLVDQQRRDPALPGLEEVLDRLLETVFTEPAVETPRQAELRRVAAAAVTRELVELAADRAAPPVVRSRVEGRLRRLAENLARGSVTGVATAAAVHHRYLEAEIRRYLERERLADQPLPVPPKPPPGSPIGQPAPHLLGCSWDG